MVASTTVVTNLNADLLDGLQAAAFALASHVHAAADVTTGTFVDARISQASVTQHQAALAIGWAQITGEPTTLAGYGITDAAAIAHTHDLEDLTTGEGTDNQVWTKGAGGAMAWEDPTGGLSNAFASVENSAGVEQFAASGADAIQFAAGADMGVAFDAGNKRVTFSFTGSLSGITRGYADIDADTGTSAAVGADTLIVAGAGGISTTSTSAPDTLTITLGNHSAALLTSGDLAVARFNGGTDASASTFWRGDGTWASAGGTFVGVRAYLNTTPQSIPTGTWTAIALNAESFDAGGYHDNATNNTRLTIPSGKAGKYGLSGFVSQASSSAGSFRGARLWKNGTTALHWNYTPIIIAGSVVGIPVFCLADLAEGDYVELQTYQDSGVSLDANAGAMYTFLEAHYLGA